MEHLFTVRTVHHTADSDSDSGLVVQDGLLDWNVAGSASIIQAVGVPHTVAADGSRSLTVLLCNMAAAGGVFEKLLYTINLKYHEKVASQAGFGLDGRVLIASGQSHISFMSISAMLANTPHQALAEQPTNMMRGFSDRRLQSPVAAGAPAAPPAPGSAAGQRASRDSDAGIFGWLLGSSATEAPSKRSSAVSTALPSSAFQGKVEASVQVSLGRVGSDDTDIDTFPSTLRVPVVHLPLPETAYSPLRSQWSPTDASSGTRLGAVTCTVWWSPWLTGVHTLLAGHTSGHVTLWDVSAIYKAIGGATPPDGATTVKQLMQRGVDDAPAELQAGARQRTPHPSGLLWWFHSPSDGAVTGLQVADCRTDVMLGEAIGVASASGSPVKGSSQLLVSMAEGRWQAALQSVTLIPSRASSDTGHLPVPQRDVDAPWSHSAPGEVLLPGLGHFSAQQQCIFSHDWSDVCAMKRSVHEADGLVSLRPLRFCSSQLAALSYARADPVTQEHRVVFAAPPVSAAGSCWALSSTLHGSLMSTAVFRPASRRLLVYRPDHDENEQLAMFLQLPPPEVMMQGIEPRGPRFDGDIDLALPLHLRAAALAGPSPLAGSAPRIRADDEQQRADPATEWTWETQDFGEFVLPHERFVWVAWTGQADDQQGNSIIQSFVAVLSVAAVATRSTNTGLTPSDARGVAMSHPFRRRSPSKEQRGGGPQAALPSSVGGTLLQRGTRQRADTMEMVLGQQAVAIPVLEKAYAGSAALAVFSLPPGEKVTSIAFGRAYLEDRAAQMDRLRSSPTSGRNVQAADCIPSAVVTTAAGVYEVAPVTITSASHFLASTAAVPSLGYALARTLGLPQAQVSAFTAIAAAAELKRRRRAGDYRQRSHGALALSDAPKIQLAVAAFESACVARTPPSDTMSMLLDTGFEDEACVYAALCMGYALPPAVLAGKTGLSAVRALLLRLSAQEGVRDSPEEASHTRLWQLACRSLVKVVNPAARSKLTARILQLAAMNGSQTPLGYISQSAEQLLQGQWLHPLGLVEVCPDVDCSAAAVSFAIAGHVLVALQLALFGDVPAVAEALASRNDLSVVGVLALARSPSSTHGTTVSADLQGIYTSKGAFAGTAAVITAALAAGHAHVLVNCDCLAWLAMLGLTGALFAGVDGPTSSTPAPGKHAPGPTLWESVLDSSAVGAQVPAASVPQVELEGWRWEALSSAATMEFMRALSTHHLVQLMCMAPPGCIAAHVGRLRAELLQLLQTGAGLSDSTPPQWVHRLAALLAQDRAPRLYSGVSGEDLCWIDGTWQKCQAELAGPTARPGGLLHGMAAMQSHSMEAFSRAMQQDSTESQYVFCGGHEGLLHSCVAGHRPKLVELGLLASLARDWIHSSSASADDEPKRQGAVSELVASYSGQALLDCFAQLGDLQAAAQAARAINDHVQACRLELAALTKQSGLPSAPISFLDAASRECASAQEAPASAACMLMAFASLANDSANHEAAQKWVQVQLKSADCPVWTIVGLACALLLVRKAAESVTVSSARPEGRAGLGSADQVSTAAATAGLSRACIMRAQGVLLALDAQLQSAVLTHPEVTSRTAQVLGSAGRREQPQLEEGMSVDEHVTSLVAFLQPRAF